MNFSSVRTTSPKASSSAFSLKLLVLTVIVIVTGFANVYLYNETTTSLSATEDSAKEITAQMFTTEGFKEIDLANH